MTIQGMPRTESEYRALPINSSSSVKMFADNRRKYYKQYILGEKEYDDDDNDNKAINTGKLVETILLENDLFDQKFWLSSLAKSPTGKMLDFVNALVKLTIESLDENGSVTKSFEEMAIEARIIAQFDWSLKVILDKFIGKDPEIFYNELLSVKANNLIVVSTLEVTMAEKIVEQLKSSFVTRDIVNLENSENFTVMNQLQIDNYTIDGLPMKSMIDKVVANHLERTLSPIDLKVTWSPESFYEQYFLFRKAWIQAFVYYRACLSLCLDPESEFYGYTVEPTKFIVCDSGAFYEPLIYSLSTDDLNDAYTGFEYKGRTYKGVNQIINELQFCLEQNMWNISKNNYLNRGVVSLKS